MPIEVIRYDLTTGEQKAMCTVKPSPVPVWITSNFLPEGIVNDVLVHCHETDIGGEIYEVDARLHKPGVLPEYLLRQSRIGSIPAFYTFLHPIRLKGGREHQLQFRHDTDQFKNDPSYIAPQPEPEAAEQTTVLLPRKIPVVLYGEEKFLEFDF